MSLQMNFFKDVIATPSAGGCTVTCDLSEKCLCREEKVLTAKRVRRTAQMYAHKSYMCRQDLSLAVNHAYTCPHVFSPSNTKVKHTHIVLL